MFVFLDKIGQMRLAIITDVSKNGKLLVYYGKLLVYYAP